MSDHRRVQTTGHSKKRKVVQVDIDRTVDRRQSLSIKIARRSSLSIIYKIKNSKNLKKSIIISKFSIYSYITGIGNTLKRWCVRWSRRRHVAQRMEIPG